MTSEIESQISKVNALITQQQERLNAPVKVPTLFSLISSGEAKSYEGNCDDISDLLEKRILFVENRRSILDDILFIIHHAIRFFVEKDIEEEVKIKIVKILEDNKEMLSDRATRLSELYLAYKSIMIEPATIDIPDGEREDPDRFQIFINPVPALTTDEGDLLKHSWWKLLQKLEDHFSTPLKLKKIT